MFFFGKKKKEQIGTVSNRAAFENAFIKRLGQTPTDYVANKISGGSDINAVRNLFDILSDEVELRDRCKSPGFDFYYEKVLSLKLLSKPSVDLYPRITKAFAVSQLIGKERFLQQYGDSLCVLSKNQEFMVFICELRQQLSGSEVSSTPTENRQIADYFFKNQANERFPEVKAIVEAVIKYGKQASAHISIYYAMYLF